MDILVKWLHLFHLPLSENLLITATYNLSNLKNLIWNIYSLFYVYVCVCVLMVASVKFVLFFVEEGEGSSRRTRAEGNRY